jgi:PIN domain nuclease of toxin-antitoxin system
MRSSIYRCIIVTHLIAKSFAQAVTEDIPIVTSDKIFRRYRGLKIIW